MAEVVVIYDDDNVIVNVSECDCGSGGGSITAFEITGNGSATYQDNQLIDKILIQLYLDGRLRQSSEYTFTSTTGTIVFYDIVDIGVFIGGIYN